MTPEAKKKYQALADEDKVRYEKEMDLYRAQSARTAPCAAKPPSHRRCDHVAAAASRRSTTYLASTQSRPEKIACQSSRETESAGCAASRSRSKRSLLSSRPSAVPHGKDANSKTQQG